MGFAGVPSSGRGNEPPVHHTRLPRYRGSSESEDTEAVHLAHNTHDIGTRPLPLARWSVWCAYRSFVSRNKPSHSSSRTNVLWHPSVRVGSSAGPNPRTKRDKGPPPGATSAQLVAGVHEVDWLANESQCRHCRMFLIHRTLAGSMTSFSTICSLPQGTKTWRHRYARFVLHPRLTQVRLSWWLCNRVWTRAQISLRTRRQRHRTRSTLTTCAQ
jgi:hypothetical protein